MALGMIPSVAPSVALGRPSGATNLVTNGGFETNTTDWAVTANNTIARSTDQKHSGAASLLCTYQDQVGLARFAATLTAATHIFSAWVYIPANWDGGAILLNDNGDYAGATGTQQASANMSLRDQWQRLSTDFTIVSGDLAGALHIRTASAPTAGRFIYVDDVQIELGTITTPYIATDGGTAARSRLKWVS